ncbi:MAG: thioredoxin family protein [Marinobacter sp.]
MLLNTPQCDFGWKAPDFTLKDASGREYSLSDNLGNKGLVVAFICNHCPYVQAIANRLADDMKELQAQGINVLAVMSNDYHLVPSDGPEYMQKFSSHFGFTFPYLVDEGQKVGKAFGAICTPDFFGFNKSGELQYRGRLDDARMDGSADRTKELVNAMVQISETGIGPTQQMASMGCSIKWR